MKRRRYLPLGDQILGALALGRTPVGQYPRGQLMEWILKRKCLLWNEKFSKDAFSKVRKTSYVTDTVPPEKQTGVYSHIAPLAASA